MSYRYPHADDSDENGFGNSSQDAQSQSLQPHPEQHRVADDSDADEVFEDSEAHNSNHDDIDDIDGEEDEYHGLSPYILV